MKTYDEWLSAVTDGCAIFAVPLEFRDYSMYLASVDHVGYALRHVPMHMRDYDMCRRAVTDNRCAIKYVPEDLHGRNFLEIMASSR
jgi:hypothetical protein